MKIQILYPLFAMYLLVSGVLMRLGYLRWHAIKNRTLPKSFYKTMGASGVQEPALMTQASRNFSNLFEMPVLFYVGVLIAFVATDVTLSMVILSWIYVGLRVCHTVVHVTFNHVMLRFGCFILSNTVLLILWILILICIKI